MISGSWFWGWPWPSPVPLLSSLIPAWQTTRADLITAIKGTLASGRSRQLGRQSLVCLQVALSLMLVTVAAALHAGFEERMLQGPGFRTDRLLLMRFDERLVDYDAAQSRQFYRQLRERVAAIPGVRSVALTSAVPLKTDTSEAMRLAPEGIRLPDDAPTVRVRSSRVDHAFFATLGIPIVEGRAVAATDTHDADGVAVVNQALASRYWPGESAIGRRVRVQRFDDAGEGSWHEIVGVAANAKYDWLGEVTQDFIYLPREQSAALQHTLLVETDRPEAVAGAVRDAVRATDPNMPMFSVRTMADLYRSRGLEVPTVIVRIVGAMGTMGLILALIGLYGLVSYTVARRTREIGIRMAVGAPPRAVLGMVLRRGVVLTLLGIVAGMAGSVTAGRALDGAIPGIGDFGPATYAVVVPALFVVILTAAYVPGAPGGRHRSVEGAEIRVAAGLGSAGRRVEH